MDKCCNSKNINHCLIKSFSNLLLKVVKKTHIGNLLGVAMKWIWQQTDNKRHRREASIIDLINNKLNKIYDKDPFLFPDNSENYFKDVLQIRNVDNTEINSKYSLADDKDFYESKEKLPYTEDEGFYSEDEDFGGKWKSKMSLLNLEDYDSDKFDVTEIGLLLMKHNELERDVKLLSLKIDEVNKFILGQKHLADEVAMRMKLARSELSKMKKEIQRHRRLQDKIIREIEEKKREASFKEYKN